MSENGPKKCMLNVICSGFLFVCKLSKSKSLVNYTQNPKTDPNKVYNVCPNLLVSRHSSCFTQKLYPKPKNGPKRLVLCKVFIENESSWNTDMFRHQNFENWNKIEAVMALTIKISWTACLLKCECQPIFCCLYNPQKYYELLDERNELTQVYSKCIIRYLN